MDTVRGVRRKIMEYGRQSSSGGSAGKLWRQEMNSTSNFLSSIKRAIYNPRRAHQLIEYVLKDSKALTG